MNAITVEGLSKSFGNMLVLDSINVRFEEGKIYGLLGRNGAGKSTLLKIISNHIFANSGSVKLNEQIATENDEAQRRLYFMSSEELYPGSLKVKKGFKWTKEFYAGFDMEKAMELSESFGLNVNKKVSALSTGYKSIFKLIIALCVDVDYVLLDEPVLGLDANHRELFYKVLLNTYMERTRTFVVATHLIEEISNLIEDIIIIDDGKILMDESVEQLKNRGYSVSGRCEDVERYCAGRQVIGEDVLGTWKTSYVLGEKGDVDASVEIGSINLQKLFVELTKKEREI